MTVSLRGLEALSEEIIIHAFKYLSPSDLACVSRVSKRWRRLSDDPSLWRSLFIAHFPHRRSKLLATDERSFKTLFKIESRWRSGVATSSTLALRSSVLERPPLDLDAPIEPARPLIVAFHRRYILTASREDGERLPSVRVHRTSAGGEDEVVGTIASASLQTWYDDRPDEPSPSITDIRLDEGESSGSQRRLGVWLSSGQWAIFGVSFDGDRVSATELFVDLSTSTAGSDVVRSSFCSPLLLTCSANGTIGFWRMTEQSGKLNIELSEPSMRSSGAVWSPTVLSLVKVEDNDRAEHVFRASIAYQTPYWPRAWTVATQIFDISFDDASPLVIRTRSATAIPSYIGPNSQRSLAAPPITSIEVDDRYLVASRDDNTIDVFELVETDDSLRLLHRRTLFGHTASVLSVSLGDGRCVSGSRDGDVKVWPLADAEHIEDGQQAVTVADAAAEDDEGDDSLASAVWRLASSPRTPQISWLKHDDERIYVVSADSSARLLSFS